MATDLFSRDMAAIEAAREAVESGVEDPEALRAMLKKIADAHSKTVRRAEKLVRVSDRSEARMREASAKIEEQQKQLELAHEMLAGYADDLESEVAARTTELRFERAKLATLVDLGIAMSAERDEAHLLSLILQGAMDLTNADGGTLYFMSDSEDSLEFRMLRNNSLNIRLGETSDRPISFPPIYLKNSDTGVANHSNVATHAVHIRSTVNIPDAYENTEFDFSGTRAFDMANGYHSKSFLTIPLIPRGGSVIGALQLLNAADPETGETIPFDAEVQGFVEALAAQAAMTIDNQKLLTAQRALMDSFIELIAGAIDAKSPYTGGHCNRVPELAMMLAQHAHESTVGPFAAFHFDTEEEWHEFRIGSWLHDCGKVTTPEYVVDKATKLETIYNRIHEVRTRFEILYRDKQISLLRERLAEHDGSFDLEAECGEMLQELQDEFAFLAECNVGGEFLSQDSVDRLAQIGERTWMRHFDDRIGISQDEHKRLRGMPAASLPAKETLLADKPQHTAPRQTAVIERLHERGFRMDVPENEVNIGELYNLSIQRGTLTNEERFKINEHIIQTLLMLETLPFPSNLKRVPEYAGGHHETMIGTGYPRKLKRNEMSVPARIMAIADIFEALTAADRPYKKAKTLSEALKIMGFMCKDQHIDPDLFLLFLEQGVYMQYAEEYLELSQIDEVSLEPLLETARTCCNAAA